MSEETRNDPAETVGPVTAEDGPVSRDATERIVPRKPRNWGQLVRTVLFTLLAVYAAAIAWNNTTPTDVDLVFWQVDGLPLIVLLLGMLLAGLLLGGLAAWFLARGKYKSAERHGS